MESQVIELLVAFGLQESATTCRKFVEHQGLSGSAMWLVDDSQGKWLLRCHAGQGWNRERLVSIHQFQHELRQAGYKKLPLPRASLEGETCIANDSGVWELNEWLPGESSFAVERGDWQIVAGLTELAQLHKAIERLYASEIGPPPGLVRRQSTSAWWMEQGQAQLLASMTANPRGMDEYRLAELATLALRMMPLLPGRLDHAAKRQIPIRPCLRDVWHAHILFSGSQVTGIVDLGSLGPDCFAADIARLLGSMAGNDRRRWDDGLAAYQHLRPLSQTEWELVDIYDYSGVILGALNWLRWLLLENRQFPQKNLVVERLEWHRERLLGFLRDDENTFFSFA